MNRVAWIADGSCERGSAAVFALLGMVFLAYYVRAGYTDLSAYIAPTGHFGLAVVIAILTILATTQAVYNILLGSKNPSVMRRRALRRADQVFHLVQRTQLELGNIEKRMMRNLLTTSAVGMRTLGVLKRLVRALELRLQEVDRLLDSWGRTDLREAYDLMTSKNLVITDSAVDWVMDAEQVPPLAPDNWAHEVEHLLRQLGNELHQAAA